MIGTSTDKYNWVNFLLQIEEELERQHITGKVVIVADNLRTHHSIYARKFYNRFEFLFTPAWSCMCNRYVEPLTVHSPAFS